MEFENSGLNIDIEVTHLIINRLTFFNCNIFVTVIYWR